MAGEYSWIRKSDGEQGLIRHQLLSNLYGREVLGYADKVDPLDWMPATVQHWLTIPPTVDGEDGRLGVADSDSAPADRLLPACEDRTRVDSGMGVTVGVNLSGRSNLKKNIMNGSSSR